MNGWAPVLLSMAAWFALCAVDESIGRDHTGMMAFGFLTAACVYIGLRIT